MAYYLQPFTDVSKIKKGMTVAFQDKPTGKVTMLKIGSKDLRRNVWRATSKRIGETFLKESDFTGGRVFLRKNKTSKKRKTTAKK